MSDRNQSIKVASRRTGLSPHVIRIWERRYGAVSPERTSTNRRLYTEEEVQRLALLRRAIEAGHSIGNIARLPSERLALLSDPSVTQETPRTGSDTLIDKAITAVKELNAAALEEILAQGAVHLGQHGLLEQVIGPMAQQIGQMWQEGHLTAAHEHFASAVIRGFLGRSSKGFALTEASPRIVVGTPAGQLHELGAAIAAAAAVDFGWRVVYLGPSLPASEIAGAAIQNQARAVALSLVYPEDDPHLPVELERLRKHLPLETSIIAGGRAADAYREALDGIGALRIKGLKDFYSHLERLRRSPRQG